MEEKQRRYQVINITIPNPTVANTVVSASVQLDRNFNRVVGIGYFEIAGGGITPNYNVTARTNRYTWVDPTIFGSWDAVTGGVAPDEKYHKVNIEYGSGDTFYVDVTPLANTSAAMSGQMVLILERTLTEVPKA